ncbi:TetR/AcrR family transcriptional regulator [Mycolicibacterium vanbaalenii]|uniref:TetR/AcrR family transcriptional regulator n=1 Tax=Mycolicibacterium vanbaalenii TaxID=110539 RepID=UPI0013308103|nr:TetR family transcriptional regulator [Mycolicibacterium vanbaalenii]
MSGQADELSETEIELERFVAKHLPACDSQRSHRGPQPSITFTGICDRAREIIDVEGLPALTVRRLADELKISTRTLYKRVGSQHVLLRGVARIHVSRMNIRVRELDTWETTAWKWCTELHRALRAHPHLTELLTDHDVQMLSRQSKDLARLATREGLPEGAATAACRCLVNVTVSDALRSTRSVSHDDTFGGGETATSTADLFRTVQWIIAGVRAEFTTTSWTDAEIAVGSKTPP